MDVTIHYAHARDEFSVKASHRNMNITDKYAVRGEFCTYDGLALIKHVLHNTSPNISKLATVVDSDRNEKKIKIRDGEKIQLANSKIDEIRGGFTEWLSGQSQEFKDCLTELYNRKFNCFVRPQYTAHTRRFPILI